MTKVRKHHNAEFKSKASVEAMKVRFQVCSPCAACCSGAMAWIAAQSEG